MTKYLTVLISLLSILLLDKTNAQKPNRKNKNDWSQMNLKGRVKLMRESIYKAKGSDNSNEDSIVYLFSDKGNKMELNNYNRNGSYMSKQTFVYDASGNQVERNLYTPEGSLIVKYTHQKSDKDNKAEEARRKLGLEICM